MSIRWRLTLFNALIIGAILLALGLALFFLLREALVSGIEETARGRAFAAATTWPPSPGRRCRRPGPRPTGGSPSS